MWLFSEIKTLGDIPRYYGRKTPDAAALIDNVGTITFGQLDERSNRLANALLGMGIKAGDRVGFFAKNTNVYFDVLFASAKIGATILPLNWRLAEPELEAVVADGSPKILISDVEYVDMSRRLRLASSEAPCPVVVFNAADPDAGEYGDLLRGSSPADPALKIDPELTVLLMYTSGTTGKPKGVQLTHQGYFYVRLCEHLEPTMRFDSNDIVLTVMPLFHAMANYFGIQALYNGAANLVYSMPAPAELMQLIAEKRPTIVPLVPTAISMLLDQPTATTENFASVRLMIYAGSSIDPKLLERAMRAIDCEFMQFYGATETGGAPASFLRPHQHNLGDLETLKSCGTPFPLTEIKVVDEYGDELPAGEVGEFLIRSPFLTIGYMNQPEVTAATFKDGWYRSGDAGYKDKDGLLYIVDRVKDMIITGGENVYSTEVEHALSRIPGIRLCAAIGLPDPKWGERVVAAVVADPDAGLSQDQVIESCRKFVAGYKVPKQVEFVSSLPMTPTGKVKKRELRDQLIKAAQAVDGLNERRSSAASAAR